MFNAFNLDRFEVYISWRISCPLKVAKCVWVSLDFARFQNNTRNPFVYTFLLSAKFHPEHEFEFTMLPASWAATRSYPLQLQPRSKLLGPLLTPTHRSTVLIPLETLEPAPTSPIRSILISSVDLGGTLEPSLSAVWDRAFSSFSVARKAFDESLESLKRCQPCLTRSEPSRISWPRCRVSRVPRVQYSGKLRDFDVPDLLNLSFCSPPPMLGENSLRVIVTFTHVYVYMYVYPWI